LLNKKPLYKMPNPEEEVIEEVKAKLGEHFQNYAIVVQWDCGEIQYEYNNTLVGKALFRESLSQMKREEDLEDEDVEVVWDDEEEDREDFGEIEYED
jgi:hypothetical protein